MSAFMRSILEWIYGLVGNYGVAVVIFTLLIRTILTPLEISSRKGMRKMSEIQPKLNALQQKYGKDQAKLQQKQQELMKKEHYNPLSGCLPLLIQWPILFIMFYAMRDVANNNIIGQAFTFLQGQTPTYEPFLWVKNVFMPDSPFKTAAVDATSLMSATAATWKEVIANLDAAQLSQVLENICAAVPAAAELAQEQILDFSSNGAVRTTVESYIMPALQSMPAYISATAPVSGWAGVNFLLFKVTLYQQFNGLLILPILSGLDPGHDDQAEPRHADPACRRPERPAVQQHEQLHEVFLPPVLRVHLPDQQRRFRPVLVRHQRVCHRSVHPDQ